MNPQLTELDPHSSEYKYQQSLHNSDQASTTANKFLYKMQLKCNNMTEITAEELPVSQNLTRVLIYESSNVKFVIKCIVFPLMLLTHVSAKS